jgi:ankyrin repeat domain-containing protein 50
MILNSHGKSAKQTTNEECVDRSTVVEHLSKRFKEVVDIGVVCIYCNYREATAQTLDNLIASLWRQLVIEKRHPLTAGVNNLYESHIERGTRPELNDVKEALRSEIENFSKVFVVVDALDECLDSNRRADLLTELRALPKVNLMVTSRPLRINECEFERSILLEISAQENDVRTYAENRIHDDKDLVRILSNNRELVNDIVNKIVENAKGMYRAQSMTLDDLSNRYPFADNTSQVLVGSTPHGFHHTQENC